MALDINISGPYQRTLPDGQTLTFARGYDFDGVWMRYWETHTADSPYRIDNLTYDEYEEYRQQHPELNMPELKPPPPATNPQGNTQGRVNGETPATGKSAEASRTTVESETPAEDDTGTKILDSLQTTLDVAGLIPGVGEIADLANAGISLARGDYAGAALSLVSAIPFAGWFGTAGKAARRGAKAAEEASEKAAKEAAERAAQEAADKSAKDAAQKKAKEEAARKQSSGEKKSGGKSKGEDRDCRPRRYGQGCPGGKTPHHIVPDRVFKMPSGARIKGGIAHKDGLCICVDGGTPVRKGPKANEHGLIHAIYDPAEAMIGKKGNPIGTAPLGVLETNGVMAASAITGCDPKKMLVAVRGYHQSKGLSPTDIFRADPSGRTIKPSALASIGKGSTPPGINGL